MISYALPLLYHHSTMHTILEVKINMSSSSSYSVSAIDVNITHSLRSTENDWQWFTESTLSYADEKEIFASRCLKPSVDNKYLFYF
uniref:Ovule protein n=1 Tax=Heterorhabditis bacteriophora TaxID=37862 RepID=A0A1I7WRI0_HETBA